ncbi:MULTISPECIES: hypothetical protein [unclassified Photorhabdus]|uniref:hypothetical protein n=1 Tax=unclassified Photorhabdus TaxID=2620880 RepID=UPI000DCD2D6A|nr:MULTISPECIES: hypothetical protein [unclassified Photorhabdus]RAW90624.1 hypothetical protein CKY03_24550 [Photorhabdus sp. S9-53]RAW90739.1 hypothetical protein CKY05_24455 [Photorhabdus sp. S10-54]RAW94441.1 hypothetical protein CKY04_24535 [Photorhabdus sp. S8-52]
MNSNSLNKQHNTSYINFEIEDALEKIEALAEAAIYLYGNKEEEMLGRGIMGVIHSVASEALKTR